VKPATHITAKVPTTEIGIARAEMSVLRPDQGAALEATRVLPQHRLHRHRLPRDLDVCRRRHAQRDER